MWSRWLMARRATMRIRQLAIMSSRQLSHWSAIRNAKYALQRDRELVVQSCRTGL